MSTKTPDETTLYSATDLARQLGRSPYGVRNAIKRNGIKPDRTLAGIAFYTEAALESLTTTMRQPNRQS